MITHFPPSESVTFLESAAEHLRAAGYSVELGVDDGTGKLAIFIEGYEVHFSRCGEKTAVARAAE